MDSTVEEVGPCKKKLTIKVPSQKIHEEIEKSYEELLSSVQLPGFRKGRVPRRLLEKRFGPEIQKDVKQNVIASSFHDAMEENQFNLLGEPEIDYEGIELNPDQDLTFEVTVEVKPEIELQDYRGMKVERPSMEVSSEQVQASLEQLAKSRATMEPADSAAEADHVLFCDLVLLQNGEIIESREEVRISPNQGHILGVPAVDLEQKLVGLEPGAEVQIELDLSQGKSEEDGEEAGDPEKVETVAKVTVKEIKKVLVPEINDAWAVELDYDDLAELSDHIRKQLSQKQEREIDRAIEDRLLTELLDRSDFQIPEGVVDRELEQAAGRYRIRLQVDGLEDENELDSKVAEYRSKAASEVYQDFRKAFLLDKLATIEKIYVTEDELEAQLHAIASAHGKTPEEVREYYENRNLMSDLRVQIREAKARAFLRTHAEITNADATEEAAKNQ